MKQFKIILLLILCISCSNDKIINNNLSINTDVYCCDLKKETFTSYNLFEDDKVSKFKLTIKDWEYIQKSYDINDIGNLKNTNLEFYKNDTGPFQFYDVILENKKGVKKLSLIGSMFKNKQMFLNKESENLNRFITDVLTIVNFAGEDVRYTKNQKDSILRNHFKKYD